MALAPVQKSPKSPPTKPERYTADQVAEALIKARGLVTAAARILECDPSTVRHYIKRYATVAAALTEARAGILDMTEARLFQAIDKGEPWAIALTLRTIGKDRGYVEKQEVQHTITPATAAELTDDELDAELKKRGLA